MIIQQIFEKIFQMNWICYVGFKDVRCFAVKKSNKSRNFGEKYEKNKKKSTQLSSSLETAPIPLPDHKIRAFLLDKYWRERQFVQKLPWIKVKFVLLFESTKNSNFRQFQIVCFFVVIGAVLSAPAEYPAGVSASLCPGMYLKEFEQFGIESLFYRRWIVSIGYYPLKYTSVLIIIDNIRKWWK